MLRSPAVFHKDKQHGDIQDAHYRLSRAGLHLQQWKRKIPTSIVKATLTESMTGERAVLWNAEHKDWACTEELMKTTKDGKALYLHCLPADITGVSCETGEVDASVFDRYRIPLYKEASFKPYVIAAMIMLSKFENPQDILKKLEVKAAPRIME